MTTHQHLPAIPTVTASMPYTPVRGLLQRKCACGGTHGLAGQCTDCNKKKARLQLKALDRSQPAASVSPSDLPVMQRKLSIGASNDPLEQEADRVAGQVLAAPSHPNFIGMRRTIRRFTTRSSEREEMVPASVDHVLASPGASLDPELQADMSRRFGHDFSRVRIHSDAVAAQSAREVNGAAYTVGHNVVFGEGRFAPGTEKGRRLLAHELTHVVQMDGFAARPNVTAAQQLPLWRQTESENIIAGLRQTTSSLKELYVVEPDPATDDAPTLIHWARERQKEFNEFNSPTERRRLIAEALLRVFKKLMEFEGRAARDRTGALVYKSPGGVAIPWTEDGAQSVDDIWPFLAYNVDRWNDAANPLDAAAPPVTTARTAASKGLTDSNRSTSRTARRGIGMDITFHKRQGMTFKTVEGRQLLTMYMIAATRKGLSSDQIRWAALEIGQKSKWEPPKDVDVTTWQDSFEAIPVGNKETVTLSENFVLELDSVMSRMPSRQVFQLERVRQGVADSNSDLGYGMLVIGGIALGGGAAVGSVLGAKAAGAGIVAAGLEGAEAVPLVGGAVGQGALSIAQGLYLNAPQLTGNVLAYGGAVLTGVSLAQHIEQIGSQGLGRSDVRQFAEDLMPLFGGYTESRFLGSAHAPTPSPPVRKGFRDRFLAAAFRGADFADVVPGIGAGGTTGGTRPVPAIVASRTPVIGDAETMPDLPGTRRASNLPDTPSRPASTPPTSSKALPEVAPVELPKLPVVSPGSGSIAAVSGIEPLAPPQKPLPRDAVRAEKDAAAQGKRDQEAARRALEQYEQDADKQKRDRKWRELQVRERQREAVAPERKPQRGEPPPKQPQRTPAKPPANLEVLSAFRVGDEVSIPDRGRSRGTIIDITNTHIVIDERFKGVKHGDVKWDIPKDKFAAWVQEGEVIRWTSIREYLMANRPAYRQGLEEEVWAQAKTRGNGRVYDPTIKPLKVLSWDRSKDRWDQWHMGHRQNHEYAKLVVRLDSEEIDETTFYREYNNPDNYRPQDPDENMKGVSPP